MSLYLHDIPLAEAQERFKNELTAANLWGVLGAESIELNEFALGRVLAESVWAIQSSPHYHASAMDGFAVRAELTAGAMPSAPVILLLQAGSPQAAYVDTGDALPVWANAVIPIENVEPLDAAGQMAEDARKPAMLRIRASVAPWSHVRPLGEDIVATQLVLPAGHVLNPFDLGAIAAAGHTTVTVARKPKIAILPTGTELVNLGAELRAGDILEYNSLVMAAQVNGMGAEATRYPITPDDFELITSRVKQAAIESDLVLLNAGSSAGSEDFSASVVARLGKLLVHGVAVRPGHPVILGMLSVPAANENKLKKVPIIGVPGYPVSAALTIEIFVENLISTWLGKAASQAQELEAQITRKTTSPAGDDDYIRVVVGEVSGKTLAAPIARGAGVITSLVRADGLVVLPRGVQGVEAGELVKVRLIRPREAIARTIFAIGSHDVILDLLSQHLSKEERRLVSVNVGSQGGLIALKRGEAHLAGSHLLDPQSGEYNFSAIRQYLPNTPVQVVGFVNREQGLIVKKGNPLGLKNLTDLMNSDVTFINRQRGAGTRVLLDYQLELAGIKPESIRGYEEEEYTHLAVAAAIASGRADCGLGIPAAAQALDLDFIPLFNERYDLIIPQVHYENALLQPLLSLLKSQSFQNAVKALPGYDTSQMGNLILEAGHV